MSQNNKISFVDGAFVNHKEAFTHIEDRGYQFADGVYEVLEVISGKLIEWQLHIERLRYSLSQLKIEFEVDPQKLAGIILELINRNNLSDTTVYLQVSRGVANRTHEYPDVKKTHPVLVVTVQNRIKPSLESYENGVKIVTYPEIRWKRCDIKTISLLPNTMAKQHAVENNAVEALFVTESGLITECSAANFYLVDKDGKVRTHAINNSILNGITRIGLLRVAKANNIEIVESAPSLDDVKNAAEAFITSTTKHVLPVVMVDGITIGNGKVGAVTKKLMSTYEEYIESQQRG